MSAEPVTLTCPCCGSHHVQGDAWTTSDAKVCENCNCGWNESNRRAPVATGGERDIIKELDAMADSAYIRYMRLSDKDECRGETIKLEKHYFGQAELDAHRAAREELGKHRAFAEAARLLLAAGYTVSRVESRTPAYARTAAMTTIGEPSMILLITPMERK